MTPMVIRVWKDGQLVAKDALAVPDATADKWLANLMPSLVEKHMHLVKGSDRVLIEIEFPDEPEESRYLRFGSDPSGMVQPVRVDEA